MKKQQERELLEKFAQAAKSKVYVSQADLDPSDIVLEEMQEWCAQQGNIVVMTSGLISPL